MTLRELMGNGRARRRDLRRSPTRATRVAPGTLFFCVPGFKVRRPRLRAGRRRARRRRARRASARSTWACPRSIVDDVRAAMGPAAARFYGDPTARARGRRHHRHQRQDHHGVPGPPPARGRRAPVRAARHGQAGGRRAARRRSSAPRPRRSTCRRTFRRDARRRRPRLRDGGVLARARAGPRGRASTSPAACSPNLTQDHLDFHETMEAYFAAKRRAVRARGGPVDRERRRRVRPPPRGRGGRRARSRSTATPTTARSTWSFDLMGSRFAAVTPDGELQLDLAAARPVQRPERARRGRRRALAGRAARDDRGGAAALRPRAGPLRAGRRGPGLRRARGLRAHARRARERAARRARDHAAGGCTWCSAPAATATAASAR